MKAHLQKWKMTYHSRYLKASPDKVLRYVELERLRYLPRDAKVFNTEVEGKGYRVLLSKYFVQHKPNAYARIMGKL